MNEDSLKKIRIDLPNHWATGGESMWAESLGNDLYKIENVPFYAYGLNFHDVVRASSSSEGLLPEVVELVEASGHNTFRVIFPNEMEEEKQNKLLESLIEIGVTYERASNIYVALDLKPETEYSLVYNKLETLEKQELLSFETCEQKEDGSFDDIKQVG